MTPKYDTLIITNIPAFYKINLWNALSEQSKIFVIFISDHSQIRTQDFIQGNITFDHTILDHNDYEHISVKRLWNLYKLLKSINFNHLMLCGWDRIEYWLGAFLANRSKNIVVVESSEHEGAQSGIKLWLKQLFLSRMSSALVSGQSQENLILSLGFKGLTITTGGVGIFHKTAIDHQHCHFRGKFLFVGRLSPEKNIPFLLDLLRLFPAYSLTIAGDGPLRKELKHTAPPNVHFIGHIPNEKLHEIYSLHDIFLLPSTTEPWGLVVEEAIFHGLPVVVSDKVGCSYEMVQNPNSGLSLPLDIDLWRQEIENNLIPNYFQFLNNCIAYDFEKRDSAQVKAFAL